MPGGSFRLHLPKKSFPLLSMAMKRDYFWGERARAFLCPAEERRMNGL